MASLFFLWTLEQLLRLEYISGVIVSTDNADAYKTSVDLGALDIGIRSKDLSVIILLNLMFGKTVLEDILIWAMILMQCLILTVHHHLEPKRI